jgi:drug/metabolite transporter (DMT)-like permease
MIAMAAIAVSAGFVQAVSSLFGRRASLSSVGVPALVLAVGAGCALAVLPWWLAPGAQLLPDPWWLAPATGLLLLLGNLCAMTAMAHGAVSLVVPVLSGKVVLVALGTALLGDTVPGSIWLGALLVCAGIAILQGGSRQLGGGLTLILALAAAVAYAVFDLLFAAHSARLGMAGLLPAATCWAVLGSLPLLAVARWPREGRLALGLCSGLHGLQTAALVGAIVIAGTATTPNILYGCRGIWCVLLVLVLGTRLGLDEGGGDRLAWRLAGATLIAIAIACTLLGGHPC